MQPRRDYSFLFLLWMVVIFTGGFLVGQLANNHKQYVNVVVVCNGTIKPVAGYFSKGQFITVSAPKAKCR